MALPLFSFDPDKGETPETLERRRKVAEAMLANIPQANTIGGGLAALGQAIGGRIGLSRANRGIAAGQAGAASRFGDFMGGIGGGTPVAGDAISGGAGADVLAGAGGGLPDYGSAIGGIESSNRYDVVGPTDPKLGRMLGKYQVAEANLGPWSQEALGRAVTPEEFLANPKLQDAIFGRKFNEYVQQFGPEGAAQAWIGGPGAVGKTGREDVLGTSVGEYGRKFTKALGGGGAPAVSDALAGGAGGDTLGAGSNPAAFDFSPFATGGAAARGDSFSGLQPEMSSGLGAMISSAPPDIQRELRVMSGFRSPETQERLWQGALKKYGSASAARKWVAPPGRSQHGFGNAIDWKFASPRAREWAHANAGKYGFSFPLSNEPWHMEVAGARGHTDARGGSPPPSASGRVPLYGRVPDLIEPGGGAGGVGVPAVAEALMGGLPQQEAAASADPAVLAAAGMIDPAAKDDIIPRQPAFVPAGGETPYDAGIPGMEYPGIPTPPMRPAEAAEAPPAAPVAPAPPGVAPVAQALGVDPLPQTSGLMGPVASSGHESLSPGRGGATAVADALGGGVGTNALAGGGGRGLIGRLFGPRPAAGGAGNPVADAMGGGAGAGGPAGTPGAPGAGGLSDRGRQAMGIMSDPWQPDEARQAAGVILKQELDQLDPKYRAELAKIQYDMAVSQAKDPWDLAKAKLDYDQALHPELVAPTQAEAAQIERSRSQTAGDAQDRRLARDRLEFDIKQGKYTNDTKGYEYYVDNERARGTPETSIKSFEEFSAAQKQAGAITIDQRAESAGDVALAGINAKKYEELQAKSASAQDMLDLYDLAEIGLQSGGYTGFGAGGIQAAQQLAVGLGLYDEEGVKAVAGTELLAGIQNRMALMTRNPDNGMGMPGAVSDRDIAFLKATNIGLDNTPEGNRLMLEVGRRLEERKIDIANLYDQWLDGDLDGKPHGIDERGFAKAAREWAKENPLFEDLKETSAAANLPPAPEGVDAEDWKYYTPEQIKLYYPDYMP